MARKLKPAMRFGFMAAVLLSFVLMGKEAVGAEIPLTQIDSANYRWLDVADNAYSNSYRSTYDYTLAGVSVTYDDAGPTFKGTLTATNLKPNFAYQLKLNGTPGTSANEQIGLAGRWWQETWDGMEWSGGTNLNSKGDGSSPNPNDTTYFSRRDIPDSSSPTGLHYRYTGYMVFDYFITDENGNATLDFVANSSYHVLWKTSQQARTDSDGPPKSSTFDPDPSSWGYPDDVDYPPNTVTIFGEWERLPVGGVFLAPGDYQAQIVLTEESFHGSGDAGSWAAAMGSPVYFSIVKSDVVKIITAQYKAKAQQLLVEATSSAQPDVFLTIDVDGVDYGMMTFDALSNKYVFRQKIFHPVENITVTSNLGGSDTVDLGGAGNKSPVADAVGDYQVTDTDGNGTEMVVLDGSGSYDPDGTVQAYEWKEGDVVLGSVAVLECEFSVGTHTVSLTVTDDKGATSSDTAFVNVLPMGGPDSVTILRAEYFRKTKQLLVEATSSKKPDAVLTLEGYGTMTFSDADSTYTINSNVDNLRKGSTVKVISSYGGKATALVTFP